jgi:hypothetical protein
MARRYRKHPQTAGRIVDGLAFVVTGEDQKLHTLNSTATHLWELAAAGCTVDEAAESLLEHFELPEAEAPEPSPRQRPRPIDERTDIPTASDSSALREQVAADARECLDDLVARRILIVEP